MNVCHVLFSIVVYLLPLFARMRLMCREANNGKFKQMTSNKHTGSMTKVTFYVEKQTTEGLGDEAASVVCTYV